MENEVTYWNVPVPKALDKALEQAIKCDWHRTKAEFIREVVRKELEKDGAWGWNFRGDYIKEMKIQKVSGDAMYQVYVIEGDDFVFESKKTDSKEPVVYKRAE